MSEKNEVKKDPGKKCPFNKNEKCVESDCALWIYPNEFHTTENRYYPIGGCSIRFIAMKNASGFIPV